MKTILVVLFIFLAQPTQAQLKDLDPYKKMCNSILEALHPNYLKRRYLQCHMHYAKNCKSKSCFKSAAQQCMEDHYRYQLSMYLKFKKQNCYKVVL